MAAPRVFLAAHHDRWSFCSRGNEPGHAQSIPGLFGHGIVIDVTASDDAVTVTRGIIRTSPQLIARPQIANTDVCKQCLQRMPIEVGGIAAVWRGADVDECLKPVLLQEGEKRLGFVIAVPRGEDDKRLRGSRGIILQRSYG
jgi:hypothetical protein